MAATASVSGLISGIDTSSIITQTMALAKKPEQQLEVKKATAQLALAQWQDINTRVLALQTKCSSIADSSSFLTRKASSSDEKIATATASTDALPGIYDIKVTSRAQSHQIASQTYTSMQSDIGTGSLSISFANNKSFAVAIDENNNTLIGVRDSINKAAKGVTATIVNQGTDTSPAYRLMLTSDTTGTENQMTILTSGVNLVMDQEVQAAKNAEVTLGSGKNAISVSKSTNTITDLIPGVTLNIVKADTTDPITISVDKDTSSIKTSIQDFVDQYNDLAKALEDQNTWDSTSTEDSPPLFGNYQLQNLQNDLVATVTGSVDGLSGEYTSLSAIGINLGDDGQLSINSSELQSALDDHQTEVSKLFGSNMDSDSALVKMGGSTTETKSSGSRGWDVDITQAARRAQVTAGQSMDSPLASDEYIVLSGTRIALTEGMTIDQVVAAINGKSNDTGLSAYTSGADGTGTGDYISIRSNYYGSRYSFNVSSNMSLSSASTTGFGFILASPDSPGGESGNGTGFTGLDVAGTINNEECTGTGQVLTADPASDTSSIKGLSIIATTTGPMNTSVRFTKGIGSSLLDYVTDLTSTTGTLAIAQNSLNDEITAIGTDITDMNTKLTATEDKLNAQYAAMETQLAKLKDTSSSLTALFASQTSSS